MILFETDRLTVKRFTSDDAEWFFQLNSNPLTMQFIRRVKNREECDVFLSENLNFYLDSSCLGRFAVWEKGPAHFVGTFSFLYLAGEADFHLGYALLPGSWGKGYATELVRKGISYYFANTTKMELFALTESENQASRHVLVKTGFQKKSGMVENGKTLELFSINRAACPGLSTESK